MAEFSRLSPAFMNVTRTWTGYTVNGLASKVARIKYAVSTTNVSRSHTTFFVTSQTQPFLTRLHENVD